MIRIIGMAPAGAAVAAGETGLTRALAAAIAYKCGKVLRAGDGCGGAVVLADHLQQWHSRPGSVRT
jgi:hypothetical protein